MNKGKEGGIKLGADIIDTYKPYRNEQGKYKKTVISRQTFEIDERYDIIDVSKLRVTQSDRAPTALWSQPRTKSRKRRRRNWWRSKK